MIPSIETIVEDLLAGSITKQQAIAWLYEHAEGSANELRDLFAGNAMQSQFIDVTWNETGGVKSSEFKAIAQASYMMADAMLEARKL